MAIEPEQATLLAPQDTVECSCAITGNKMNVSNAKMEGQADLMASSSSRWEDSEVFRLSPGR